MISGLQTFSDLDCGFHHWIMISENAEWVGCGCGVTSQDERENISEQNVK